MQYNQKLLGQNLRIEREKRNLSREQFAAIMGVSTDYIGLVERGTKGYSNKNLCKLNELFGISLDSVFLNTYDSETKHLKMKPIAISEYINNSNFSDLELYLLISMLAAYVELKNKEDMSEQETLEQYDVDLD